MITSEQVRAARALLRWEQKDLADASAVSLPSIKRLETQPGALTAQDRTVDAIKSAFEQAGIVFLEEGQLIQAGVGVRRKIFEDPAESARLQYDDQDIACLTLQEARIAWGALVPDVRRRATIVTKAGKRYNAEEIECLYSRPAKSAESETIQYPEFKDGDGGPGSGG